MSAGTAAAWQSPFVIRGPEVQARTDASMILEQAHDDASRVRAEAALAFEAERARGREEGLREGSQAAARLLADASASADAYLEAHEADLVDLAFAIAQRIIADLTPDEALSRIARAALAEHRADTRLTLRAAPDAMQALGFALDEDQGGRIALELDPDLPAGACILVHERGRTALGIVDQFRALMRGVAAA